MGFRLHKQFGPSRTVRYVINNSITVAIGDAVVCRTGVAVLGTAGVGLRGIVMALEDKNGNCVFGSIAVLGGASVSGNSSSGYVTTGSANTTTDKITAVIETSKEAVYSGEQNGTINTTNTSATAGGWIDLTDEDTLDESSHSRTITTGGQFLTHGADPRDSTRILVSINESEAWSTGDPMTA